MIHVLTLTWNGIDKLKKLAPTLEAASVNLRHNVRWYVRDNGSEDGTKEWLKETYSSEIATSLNKDCVFSFKLLDAKHNRDNFAQGVNSLFDMANPKPDDFILLLNNDVTFGDKTSLANMLDLMKKPEIAVVGARLLYGGTNKLQHAGVIFGPRYGNMPYHYRHQEESDEHAEKNRYFQAVTAACCLVKAKEFMPLDTKFNWAFEDIDLFLRIGQKKRIAYCGKTKIFHEESSSLKKNPVNRLFLKSNVSRFKEKWFGKYTLDHERYLKRLNHMLIK